MHYRCLCWFCWLFISITFTDLTHAQKSSISGIIYSTDSILVAGAHILLQNTTEEKAIKTTISDFEGHYNLEGIASGTYLLSVRSLGFETIKIELDIISDEIVNKNIYLPIRVYQSEIEVVTATRTLKDIEDVSVPISVVREKDIESSGSSRLAAVLSAQTGLNVVSDHGKGIQVQGFDPEYTLILIDNQPLIGRTAGTLDLNRISIGDIQQIEIVKGPSSALWGSDALAGVINIITKKGDDPFNFDISGRYGSNTSYDGSANLAFRQNKISGRFFSNINGSKGFDLNSQNISPSVPEHQSHTFSGGLDYKLNSHIKFHVRSRYYHENLNYLSDALIGNTTQRIQGNEFQENFSLTPQIDWHAGNRQLFEIIYHFSRHNSESRSEFQNSNTVYDLRTFDQQLSKYEIKSSTFWNLEHTTVLGTGINRENLVSEIYAEVPVFHNIFVYGQHEWNPNKKLSLTAGFRLDAHSEYASQLSPKFSGLYKFNDLIHIRASFGGGYKAPGFSELFLNFTNPQVGYSVYGATTVEQGILQLQSEGQIKELLIDPATIGEIKAEHSFAFNAGVDLYPANWLHLRFNAFRNDVLDLLETQRIAIKNNGQSVFSYFNLNKIYTQGIEAELRFKPPSMSDLQFTLGYQYLNAQRQITLQKDDVLNGEVVSISRKDYIPMFSRPEHSLKARLYYYLASLKLQNSLILKYNGAYWYADQKVNNKVDDEELSDPHLIIDYSLTKTIHRRVQLRVGINNLTNYKSQRFLPSNPGITFYTQLNIQLY